MSMVVRVPDELGKKIKNAKAELEIKHHKKKWGRPPSIWNSDLNDWDIRIVYNPKFPKRKKV